MGRKKKKGGESRLAAMVADRKAEQTRRRDSDDDVDDVDIELSAMEMLSKYKDETDTDHRGQRLRKKVSSARTEKKLCCCCAMRHCVGCLLIFLLILTILAVVAAMNWDAVKAEIDFILGT